MYPLIYLQLADVADDVVHIPLGKARTRRHIAEYPVVLLDPAIHGVAESEIGVMVGFVKRTPRNWQTPPVSPSDSAPEWVEVELAPERLIPQPPGRGSVVKSDPSIGR